MRKIVTAAGAAALVSATSLAGHALAAPAAADQNAGLEEIVVTAEKRDSTVQATAISLTALS